MSAGIKTVEIDNGHEIVLCEAHSYEDCHMCGLCFGEMNEEARQQASMDRAERTKIRKGLLRKGTTVRMKDRSGRTPPKDYVATITGVQNGDPHDFGDDLLCYVVKGVDELAERCLVEVEELHEEWTLEGVTFDQIKRVVLDGERHDEGCASRDSEDFVCL